MMTAALAFLSNPLRAITTAALVALLAFSGLQTLRLAHSRLDVSNLKAEIVSLEADIAVLNRQLSDQNARVLDLEALTKAQAEKAAQAQEKAAAERRALEKRLQALRREKVPQDCPGAVQWLGDKGREQAKRWEGK